MNRVTMFLGVHRFNYYGYDSFDPEPVKATLARLLEEANVVDLRIEVSGRFNVQQQRLHWEMGLRHPAAFFFTWLRNLPAKRRRVSMRQLQVDYALANWPRFLKSEVWAAMAAESKIILEIGDVHLAYDFDYNVAAARNQIRETLTGLLKKGEDFEIVGIAQCVHRTFEVDRETVPGDGELAYWIGFAEGLLYRADQKTV